jgi:hypothetical protein
VDDDIRGLGWFTIILSVVLLFGGCLCWLFVLTEVVLWLFGVWS